MDTIIFVSMNGASWMTNDCGKTLFLVDNGQKYLNFKFHPHNPKQILALYRKECKKTSMCVSHTVLSLTEDAGKTWKPIKTFVFDYDWYELLDEGASMQSMPMVWEAMAYLLPSKKMSLRISPTLWEPLLMEYQHIFLGTFSKRRTGSFIKDSSSGYRNVASTWRH